MAQLADYREIKRKKDTTIRSPGQMLMVSMKHRNIFFWVFLFFVFLGGVLLLLFLLFIYVCVFMCACCWGGRELEKRDRHIINTWFYRRF